MRCSADRSVQIQLDSVEEYCFKTQVFATGDFPLEILEDFAIGKIKFDPAGTFLSEGTCSLGPVTSRWRATKSGRG